MERLSAFSCLFCHFLCPVQLKNVSQRFLLLCLKWLPYDWSIFFSWYLSARGWSFCFSPLFRSRCDLNIFRMGIYYFFWKDSVSLFSQFHFCGVSLDKLLPRTSWLRRSSLRDWNDTRFSEEVFFWGSQLGLLSLICFPYIVVERTNSTDDQKHIWVRDNFRLLISVLRNSARFRSCVFSCFMS